MKTTAVTLMLLLLVTPALAAPFAGPVDGNWSGSVPGPNGDITLGFVFKADGDKLNGSMIGQDGNPLPIANGKIDGNNIAFTVTIQMGNTIDIGFKGVVGEDEIKMSGDFQGQAFDFVLKKAK
jgi:hypothetical protein